MKNKLVELADKYETKDFLKNDPSQFLYYYKTVRDTELCAFIAALLSFGSRKQFIPKINFIMNEADKSGGIYKWILDRIYKKAFCANDEKKFYRFYSYDDFYDFGMSEEDMLSFGGWWGTDGDLYVSLSYYDGVVTVDHLTELPDYSNLFGE